MISSDFVTSLTHATHPRLDKVQVRALLEQFIKIVLALPVGEELVIGGFGAFRKVRTGPRIVYAPPKGSLGLGTNSQAYRIPPMEVLKFRAFPKTKRRLK